MKILNKNQILFLFLFLFCFSLTLLSSSLFLLNYGRSVLLVNKITQASREKHGHGLNLKIPFLEKAYFFDQKIRFTKISFSKCLIGLFWVPSSLSVFQHTVDNSLEINHFFFESKLKKNFEINLCDIANQNNQKLAPIYEFFLSKHGIRIIKIIF